MTLPFAKQRTTSLALLTPTLTTALSDTPLLTPRYHTTTYIIPPIKMFRINVPEGIPGLQFEAYVGTGWIL